MTRYLSNASWKTKIGQGVQAAWPICMGYLPIGLAFGVIAQKAGLGPFQIALMSILVFAGSSQFIAVSMISSGASVFSIVLTTFIVNLRHFLMSAALALRLGNTSWKKLSLFAYGVTDESFAVNYVRLLRQEWDIDRSLVLHHTANATWVAATVTGGVAGQFIPAGACGIDYALTAMFVCLLIFQLRRLEHMVAAVVSGFSAVVLSLMTDGNGFVVVAALLGATAASFWNRRQMKNDDGSIPAQEGPF